MQMQENGVYQNSKKTLGLWLSFLLSTLLFYYLCVILIGLDIHSGIVNTTYFLYFIENTGRNLPGVFAMLVFVRGIFTAL